MMTPTLAREKDSFLLAAETVARTRRGKDPAWMEKLRDDALSSLESLQLPTTRHEEWKYTNIAPILRLDLFHSNALEPNRVSSDSLRASTFAEGKQSLLVFINGHFSAELSDTSGIAAGITVGNIADVTARDPRRLREHLGTYASWRDSALTAANTALISDGAVVHIPERAVVESPIHVLYIATPSELANSFHPRTLVIVERDAIATVIESYVSLEDETVYFTNAVTEVAVAEGARLDHYRLQEESEKAFHIGRTEIAQSGSSTYNSCAISIGARLARHDLNLKLDGERSESSIDGLYVASDGQHVDNHTSIDHQHPNCASHQLYKGILDGDGRAVFNGKIFVRQQALHTDARQLNKNLVLSSEASVDTKPQLEIFADDVKCAHGATVGQLEDEELFYLASRGLDPERARALLTYGFAEDVISRISLKSAREQLDRIVLDKLHQSLEVQ
jgi:Fe-S cluster assembly protein SufD